MISYLRGALLEKHPNQVIVDVQGVGYELTIPVTTFSTLPEAGSEVRLRVHTHVREDAISLFGFADPSRKNALREADQCERNRAEARGHGAVRFGGV